MRKLKKPPAPRNPRRLPFHINIRDERNPKATPRQEDFVLQDIVLRVEAVHSPLTGLQTRTSFQLARGQLAIQLRSQMDMTIQDEMTEVFTAFHQMFDRIYDEMKQRQAVESALREEQSKSDKLLLNVLPACIADRLKEKESAIADKFESVTILFADLVNFTTLSTHIMPVDLVCLLNNIFSRFDDLAEANGLEKIKTIGDAYMVVGGIPMEKLDHAQAIANMALQMREALTEFNTETNQNFALRIGINTGPVVAGVIGRRKFAYDLWGDTVNVASRMESHGIPGKIQVTHETYLQIRDTPFSV